uniref:Major facilitator superfamily (MFS) profile domain-containing protein n=1 Tax=Zooxanthella nutricula TaxID=1333877 RepID=A0A7S2HZ58_9DINO
MPASGRTRRFLTVASAAHFVLNMGIVAQAGFLGAVHTALIEQAGGGAAESLMLVAAGLGDVLGNLLAGWWMDRWPCHRLFAASAFVSAANLAVMPHLTGVWSMALASFLLMQGSGIGDCSFGALIWVARECGVNNDGMYTGMKNLGTCLGMVLIMVLALCTTTPRDYRVLAYAWSALCAVAGVWIASLPSPTAPKEAAAARAAPGAPSAIAWRETLVVCLGGALSAAVVGVFIIAFTLPATWIGTHASQRLLLALACVNLVGQFVVSPVMDKFPPAVVHVALLLISALGCALVCAAFLDASGRPSPTLMWSGYMLIGSALLTNFSVLFSFMSSLVNLSGARSSILGLGAATNPLIGAAAATIPLPAVMWAGCALLLVASAGVVVVLAVYGPAWLQKDKKEF